MKNYKLCNTSKNQNDFTTTLLILAHCSKVIFIIYQLNFILFKFLVFIKGPSPPFRIRNEKDRPFRACLKLYIKFNIFIVIFCLNFAGCVTLLSLLLQQVLVLLRHQHLFLSHLLCKICQIFFLIYIYRFHIRCLLKLHCL